MSPFDGEVAAVTGAVSGIGRARGEARPFRHQIGGRRRSHENNSRPVREWRVPAIRLECGRIHVPMLIAEVRNQLVRVLTESAVGQEEVRQIHIGHDKGGAAGSSEVDVDAICERRISGAFEVAERIRTAPEGNHPVLPGDVSPKNDPRLVEESPVVDNLANGLFERPHHGGTAAAGDRPMLGPIP